MWKPTFLCTRKDHSLPQHNLGYSSSTPRAAATTYSKIMSCAIGEPCLLPDMAYGPSNMDRPTLVYVVTASKALAARYS